ncbi:MAG: VOC family protein [Gemmatimonadota bacterium]|nr:VOC family protein [Gemmatimonadota bacterium]
MTVSPGRFVWHEVMTTDPDAAIAFYEKAIGWRLMPWDVDPKYRMLAWNNVPMAGVMLLPEEARLMGAPPHWMTYITVRDVDASMAQAMGMGARTYFGPMDVPTVGRLAVLADPQGATFAVFRPENDGHVSDDMVVGDFSWHELAADDWKAAWEFYRALFGWEHDGDFDMGPMGTYWMFRRAGGSRSLGGMYNRPPEVPATHWLPYVHVAHADATAAAVGRHGGRVLNGPMAVPGPSGDRVAQLMDPQGAVFAVHSVAPVAAAPPPAPKPAPRRPATKRKPTAAKPAAKRPVKKAPARKAAKPKGRPVKKKPAKKR